MIKKIILKVYFSLFAKKEETLVEKYNIQRQGENLFYRERDGFKIYSNKAQNLAGTFNKIFIDNIYNFKPQSRKPFIIDAGANIGLATLYWKLKFPEAEVLAFEPSHAVFEVLKKNVRESKFEGIECINSALSNRDGESFFTSNEALSGSLMLEKRLDRNYKVKTEILSKYLTKRVDLLKLDIEGAEYEVIHEIKDYLSMIDRVFVEYHSFVHLMPNLGKILTLLEEAGFRYYIQEEYKITSPFLSIGESLGQDYQGNIWAMRN